MTERIQKDHEKEALALEEPLIPGEAIILDKARRAKYHEQTAKHVEVITKGAKLAAQGKNATEILSELGLPNHDTH